MSVSTHRRPRTRVAITAGRLGIGLAFLVALVMAPVTVFGHTGSITASENCETFDVRVFLNTDVKSDHVTVTTTIPGTTGFENHSFDTTGNSGPVEILHLTGAAPKSGTVTLKIDTEFTTSESIHPPSNCTQPTPTPTPEEATPTPTPTPTPKEATPTPTPTPTPEEATPTPTPTPGGGVGGVTGTPRPKVTLPPTDTAAMPAASGEPSIVAVLFVMVAASAIATIALRPRKGVRARNR